MSFKVRTVPKFDSELKKLVKKYPSLKMEFLTLITSLKEDPSQGTPLGRQCYKIRLAIASKGKGRSGGGRVITCLHISDGIVYLLTIFDKSERENIADKDIKELLKWLP